MRKPTPFEKKRAKWLAEALARPAAVVAHRRSPPAPTPAPQGVVACHPSPRSPPAPAVVARAESSLGEFRVEQGRGRRFPWRIVGPDGSVWGVRASSGLAIAAMRRFASQWPVAQSQGERDTVQP